MKFISRINAILAEDAQSFASSFGLPRLEPWITKQYDNGYTSNKDYEEIVDWVSDNNPNIDSYDFNNALKQAKTYNKSKRKDGFNLRAELLSKDVIKEFDNGKKWLKIGPEDCNAVCHRLQYDCSKELMPVFNNDGKCYALQDPQDNTICVFTISNNKHSIIGQFGKQVTDNNEEIKDLCTLNGIEQVPESYNNVELSKALATKQLDIKNCHDIGSVIKRLSAIDIINCDLIRYSHHANIKTIYDIYKKTNHSCLILYAFCYLASNNHMNTEAYSIIKQSALKDKTVKSLISKNNKSDNRYYMDLLNKAVKQISSL